MARLPRRDAEPPEGDVLSIVDSLKAEQPGAQRRARLRVQEDALVYRLLAKRLRQRERIADGVAKFVGGSLLTTSVALLLGGHFGAGPVIVATAALLLLVAGIMFAARFDYQAAAWDSEADRIAVALAELDRGNADG